MKITLRASWKDQPILATILQIAAAVLLLVAIVFCCATIGVFTKEFNHQQAKNKGDNVDVCLLYAATSDYAGFKYVKPGDNSYCKSVIYGQSVVLITLAVLVMLLILTVFIRFDFAIEVITFFGIAVISFMLCVAASIILTAGFTKTCKTIHDTSNGATRCSSDLFSKEHNVLIQSTVFSWVETVSIGTLIVVAGVYLAMRMKRREGYENIK